MIEKRELPILEFDRNKKSIINPPVSKSPLISTEKAVICFFQEIIDKLNSENKLTLIKNIKTEIGSHPVYSMEYNGETLGLFHPGVGAPLAVGMTEEVIGMGFRKFIACGGAGVLDGDIVSGHVIVPSVAVRDEGTSYHYMEPTREVEMNSIALKVIKKVLDSSEMDYLIGKTWTTDAIYRETSDKIKLRKSEGCITVEMETASLFALSCFRDVIIGQILYGGDDISGDVWDERDWTKLSAREIIFYLAVESCLKL
jgi:uridine phosphorylase